MKALTTLPHHTIARFFSTFHLHEAIDQTARLFKWACKEGYCKKRAPGELLFFVQQLGQLLAAAEEIHYSTGKRFSAVRDADALEAPIPVLLSGARTTAWQCLPRHLSAAEYLNPYFAFEKLACRAPWEPVLQELLECALGRNSIEGYLPVGELMGWREVMMAVVEAAWLVEARNRK